MLSKLGRLCLFPSGISLVLVGLLLCLDAFLPKEKPVSAWGPAVELLMGCASLGVGVLLWNKFRPGKTTRHRAEQGP
jgi:drug/metabolite transporter (DMT)-like permease